MSLTYAHSMRPLRFVHNCLGHLPISRFRVGGLLLLLCGTALGYAQDAVSFKKVGDHILQTHVMNKQQIRPGTKSEFARPRPQSKLATSKLTPVNTGTGVVFTCDPNVAVSTCNYLNSTVAGNLNGTFTNANAQIYILYGNAGLGQSNGYLNAITYSQFVGALQANTNQSAEQTTALSSLNTYDATIYGSGNVEVSAALGANVGFGSSMTGITSPETNEQTCTLGTAGCYDTIVTVADAAMQAAGGFTFYYDDQGGTELSTAYDFYGVVAHEADESLGTSSCVSTQDPSGLTNGCTFFGAGTPSAVDLFRYAGAGTLASVSTPSATPGQYFSYDGGNTNPLVGRNSSPKVYNTLDNGDDYADYLSTSPDCGTGIAVQDAEGCPGEDAGLSILNDGGSEIIILNALGYNYPAAVVPATPTFSPNGGTFTSATPVMILDSTTGASIFYTTNGSTPNSNSTPYNGTITVSTSETINAVAILNGVSSATGSAVFTINSGTGGTTPQTVSITPISVQQVGAAVTLNASASSGLPVTFSTTTSTICTVSGSQVTTIAGGVCNIVASQAGNSQYKAASAATHFTVQKMVQTLTITPIPGQSVGASVTLSASASSGLPVTFSATPSSVCTLSGSTLNLVAAGTCTVYYTQAGNTVYQPETNWRTVKVALDSQTVTVTPVPTQVIGAVVTLNASASSGLPVTFSTTSPSVCTVSGDTATMIAKGICNIVATQAGNSQYAAKTGTTHFAVQQ